MYSVYRRRAVALHACGSLRTVSSTRAEDEERVPYTLGTHQLVPKKYTVGRKIAVRSYLDRNRTELSDRTYFPQKHYFEPYVPKAFAHDYELSAHLFYSVETKLIWKAFDTPELVPMLLFDETVKTSAGRRSVGSDEESGGSDNATRFHTNLFSVNMMDNALHWTRETRYWRCLGITKPFFDKNTLRVHCWEDDGMQVGTLKMSAAMRHALMDLERAWRRKELGLEPNYLWDNWGPIGFIDGRKTDYLPRFEHNPYVDPDGVEVSEVDILPFNTHEQIRERYGEFIYPETTPFEGVFLSPSHSTLTLEDVPNEEVVELYKQLQQESGAKKNQLALNSESSSAVSPADMRALFYLCADPTLLEDILKGLSDASSSSSSARKYRTWEDVREAVAPLQEENDLKIDFARLLDNTRHSAERVRSFYEEKCGFVDFAYTNDKTITAATMALLSDMRTVLEQHGEAWATNLANALTDVERFNAMGPTAFRVFRLIENAIVDHRRRQWATRFAGESNEESTLDYLLENFGRRPERQKSVGSTGVEFDREQEPIGRQVQRRVLDSDKSNKLADFRRSKGRIWNKKKNVFEALHQKQLQNFSYGVR